MNRRKVLLKAFSREKLLTLHSPFYRSWVERFIIDETKADLGTKGDITTNAILNGKKHARAQVVGREPGIAAGIEEASHLYRKNGLQVKQIKKDGQRIKKGDILLELQGEKKALFRIERSAVDILQRMSGIATLTAQVFRSINYKVPIAPTRKTQWRYLDKKAVSLGGGLTHRLALWEAILIKDNHLKMLKSEGEKDPIRTAMQRAHAYKKKSTFIEIEVTTLRQACRAAAMFKEMNSSVPSLIMLDNMTPAQINKTIKELKKNKLYDYALLEASGGINPKNIKKYARTKVDVISMGYLTHSAHALDIKQYIL